MKKFILILFPALFLMGCNTSRLESSYEEGYNSGKDTGYKNGVIDGRIAGFEEGKEQGYTQGVQDGYDKCKKEGLNNISKESCREYEQKAYNQGLIQGQIDGGLLPWNATEPYSSTSYKSRI